jgi:hypothetical protein
MENNAKYHKSFLVGMLVTKCVGLMPKNKKFDFIDLILLKITHALQIICTPQMYLKIMEKKLKNSF